MAKYAGMWTSRNTQLRKFLESGLDVMRIPVEAHEQRKCVTNAFQRAIRDNPYFAARIDVFTRKDRVFLIRKDRP